MLHPGHQFFQLVLSLHFKLRISGLSLFALKTIRQEIIGNTQAQFKKEKEQFL